MGFSRISASQVIWLSEQIDGRVKADVRSAARKMTCISAPSAYCPMIYRRRTSDVERIVVEKERQATSISRLLETGRLRAEGLHPLRRARGNDRYDR